MGYTARLMVCVVVLLHFSSTINLTHLDIARISDFHSSKEAHERPSSYDDQYIEYSMYNNARLTTTFPDPHLYNVPIVFISHYSNNEFNICNNFQPLPFYFSIPDLTRTTPTFPTTQLRDAHIINITSSQQQGLNIRKNFKSNGHF